MKSFAAGREPEGTQTMTKKQIHERRRQLEEQGKNAYRATLSANDTHTQLRAELATAKSALENARVENAKGMPDVDVDAAIERVARAEAQLTEVKAQGNAAQLAWDQSKDELSEFLRIHFEVFAEDAIRLAERAEEGLQKANRAVMLAENLWREATAAWQPLCAAVKTAGPPGFPLSRAPMITARPPALVVSEDAEAAA